MSPSGGTALSALYQEKLRLFKNLQMLSKQCAAISVDSRKLVDTGVTRLQALLDERAKIIAEIDAVDAQILACDAGDEEREDTSAIRNEIFRVAEQIRQMDARLQALLEEETGMLREAARVEQRQQRTARAYQHRPEAGEGFFVDKRT